mgnify:CR=1 FL=1
MANLDVGNRQRVVDKRRGRGTAVNPITSDANMKDITAMRARLTAINATTFTAARLNTMTENDMLYAIRMNDDAAGIK